MNENTFNDNVKNTNRLPRMRTIPKAYAEIKVLDPDTSFSIRELRKLVNNGDLPTVKISNKCALPEKTDKKRRQKNE